MKIVTNDQLTSMLNHIAAGKEKITGVVVKHSDSVLQFKIDDKIQLAVSVDLRKGLKAHSSFDLIMADLSIVAVEGGKPLPAVAVPRSSSARGCSREDAAFLKSFNC